MSKFGWRITATLIVIMAAFIGGAYLIQVRNKKVLPIYGIDQETLKPPVVKDFSLMNQEGKTITLKDCDGHVFVANFFFAKCQGICPSMNHQLSRVYEKFKGNNQVLFLSYSVKPAEDSVLALREYARLYNADASQWWFLTGDKKMIYDLARNSYMASISEGDGGPDDFVHTQMLTLVDKNKHLRGFYDGLDSTQVNQLMTDIDVLLAE